MASFRYGRIPQLLNPDKLRPAISTSPKDKDSHCRRAFKGKRVQHLIVMSIILTWSNLLLGEELLYLQLATIHS